MLQRDHQARTPNSKAVNTPSRKPQKAPDVVGSLPDATLEPPATPPLRWEKIYEARQRLEQGEYQNPADLEEVADWLDSVFGDQRGVG
ncbi:MAG: hypothetical protein AAF797_01055 [Planctomycetota bacterium]